MDLPYTSLPRGLELQVHKYFEQKKMQHLFDNNLFEWIVKISNNDPLLSTRDNISKKKMASLEQFCSIGVEKSEGFTSTGWTEWFELISFQVL